MCVPTEERIQQIEKSRQLCNVLGIILMIIILIVIIMCSIMKAKINKLQKIYCHDTKIGHQRISYNQSQRPETIVNEIKTQLDIYL